MYFPNLVLDFTQTTPCKVVLTSETPDNFGNYKEYDLGTLKGKYKDTARVREDAKRTKVQITGTLKFNGDIAPLLPTIGNGYVEIFGTKRNIVKGSKKRNFDGSVNFCELELE